MRASLIPRLVLTGIALAVLAACAGGGEAIPPAPSSPRPSTSAPTIASIATSAPTQPSATAPAPTTAPAAVYQSSATRLNAATRARMDGMSWHPGCPVSMDQLRLLRVSYWGFDDAVHQGDLIVNASAATTSTSPPTACEHPPPGRPAWTRNLPMAPSAWLEHAFGAIG